MKTFIWRAGVIALLVTGPSISSAAAAPKGTATADKRLDDRIEHRIKQDASLKKYDIDVSVKNRVATLTGAVATDSERTRAEELAHVKGVSRVTNQIVVDRGAATKGTVGTLADKTKAGAEKAGEKTKEAISKTGEVITDGWITT